jgi:hypothetical protein
LIERWWDQHSKEPVVCPVCKTSDWKIIGRLVNDERPTADAAASDTPSHPHIIISCKFCAHAMFFDAVQIGITAIPLAPHGLIKGSAA